MALAWTVWSGCASSQPWKDPGPAAVFEAFLRHGYLDEGAEAWALVAPADREAIEATRASLAGKVPAAVLPAPHAMLAVVRLDNPYAIKKVHVEPALGDSAPKDGARVRLDVEYVSGERSAATMVWTSERWFVDLPLPEKRP